MDVLRRVVEHSDVFTLTSWRLTSHAFFTITATTLRSRYLHLLRIFFDDDVLLFDALLDRHACIVSGSLALLFMLWTEPWEPGDLDVYVSGPSYSEFINSFELTFPFMTCTGRPRRRDGKYNSTKILALRQYMSPDGKKIDIIQSVDPNPAAPLVQFWTSLVINFIAPHAAVCGYPKTTLQRQGLVTFSAMPTRTISAHAKYQRRGMTFNAVQRWGPPLGDETPALFVEDRPLLLDFRTRLDLPRANFPIRPTTIGWLLKMPYPDPSDGEVLLLMSLRAVRNIVHPVYLVRTSGTSAFSSRRQLRRGRRISPPCWSRSAIRSCYLPFRPRPLQQRLRSLI